MTAPVDPMILVRAVTLAANGDRHAALQTIYPFFDTPADIFAASMALANAIASTVPGDGPVMVDVERITPGGTEQSETGAEAMAALIAAAGNGDYRGAAALFFALEPEVAGRVVLDLLMIAGECAKGEP